MRPYLAIIKDSFRAAMASRVLYVLLLLITILLLAIAPLHLRETLDWRLSADVNVRNPGKLVRRIVEDNETQKPIGRIWELLSPQIKKKITGIVERTDEENKKPENPGAMPRSVGDMLIQQDLIDELNDIIADPEFYRAEDWESRILPSEAEDFVESGVSELTEIRSKRLNRLLISTAVAPTIDTGEATALVLKYAVWEFPVPISMTHQQFAQMLTSSIPWVSLPWYFEKLVLSIGLLIAIIVTANMIPDMFEPGSLNLLLSKPISRWGLFTSKFFGGCVFIGLCAAYLFFGLWIWMGFGMGVWDRAMLLSIPLYIIVFAIYFSVSAVVGLIYRSPIVSVILTLLFWAFCFAVGSAFTPFDKKMRNSEFVALVPMGSEVYATDVLHRLKSWDEGEKEWSLALDSEMGQQVEMQFAVNSFIVSMREFPAMPGIADVLTPVYDRGGSQVMSSSYDFGKSLSSGKKRMFVASVDDGTTKEFRDVGYFPVDATRLFETPNGVVTVTSDGSFYRLDQTKLDEVTKLAAEKEKKKSTKSGDKKAAATASETEKAEVGATEDEAETEVKDESQPDVDDAITEDMDERKKFPELFERIGPDSPFAVRTANHVGFSYLRNEFAIYRKGKLKIFKSADDKYEHHAELELELGFETGMTSRIAYQGNTIVLAFGNGKVITVDAETMLEKNEFQPENRSAIEEVHGSTSGRYFGVLYRNGNLWLLDTEASTSQMNLASVTGQGEVCTFAFGENDQLWVCDNTDRATNYELASGKQGVRHSPPGGWIEKIYRYGLRPAYKVCPKPGEFYKVVSHLSSAGDSATNSDVDLNKTMEVSDPWSPLWSGLLFMAVMLGFGCWVFQFRDY